MRVFSKQTVRKKQERWVVSEIPEVQIMERVARTPVQHLVAVSKSVLLGGQT